MMMMMMMTTTTMIKISHINKNCNLVAGEYEQSREMYSNSVYSFSSTLTSVKNLQWLYITILVYADRIERNINPQRRTLKKWYNIMYSYITLQSVAFYATQNTLQQT
jgi:hypothetical protein